jgi:hypothetical protein
VRSAFNISSSLINVSVFAGGSVLGAIAGLLSTQSDTFDEIIDLFCLSAAFFMVSLFLSIGVQVVLRRDDPDERPVGGKAVVVTVHLFVALGGILGGFMVLCFAMMKFGRVVVGGVGLGLLSLIPLWVATLFLVEWKHGLLHELPEAQDERGDPSPQTSQNKF